MQISLNVPEGFDIDQPLFNASGDLLGYPEQAEAKWLTTKEAAESMGLAQVTVGVMCKAGKLKCRMVANRWLVDAGEVDNLKSGKK